MSSSRIALFALLLTGCDRSGTDLLPQFYSDYPPVLESGELQVITAQDLSDFQAASDKQAWCDETDASGARRCLAAQVGPPDSIQQGGATYTFKGTGKKVCLIVDPETVFWNQSIAINGRTEDYAYPDYQNDDGDIDMFAGMSAYYTGSPGIEIGDFEGFYTDSLGRQLQIEYGECFQQGSSQSDISNAHAGRGTVEYCDIDTDQREGVEFTVVLETFSVPLDDGVLSFTAMAVEGECSRITGQGIDECTITGESVDPDGTTRACTTQLENAYCTSQFSEEAWADWPPLKAFCCANPQMCGDEPEDSMCLDFDADAFCADKPDWCCQ